MFSRHIKLGLMGLLVLPLMGISTCLEEKTIELVVTSFTEHGFEARGSINVDLGSGTFDVKEQLDLNQILLDNDIDANEISEITMKALCYRIVVPQGGRSITDGELTEQWGTRGAVILASGFPAISASAATDWIDITPMLMTAGVDEINAFLARCLADLQGGGPASDTNVMYSWQGTSQPTNEDTNFDWAVKIVVNIKSSVKLDLPF